MFTLTRWMRDEKGEYILENGKRQLEFVAVQRADTNQWAIPGVSAFISLFPCLVMYCLRLGALFQA